MRANLTLALIAATMHSEPEEATDSLPVESVPVESDQVYDMGPYAVWPLQPPPETDVQLLANIEKMCFPFMGSERPMNRAQRRAARKRSKK